MDKHHFSSEENAEPCGITHIVTHVSINIYKLTLNMLIIGQFYLYTVQITYKTRLVFGNCVCTCVTKHSNAFRTFLNWLKNSKRVGHEPKLHISRLPLFTNFDL